MWKSRGSLGTRVSFKPRARHARWEFTIWNPTLQVLPTPSLRYAPQPRYKQGLREWVLRTWIFKRLALESAATHWVYIYIHPRNKQPVLMFYCDFIYRECLTLTELRTAATFTENWVTDVEQLICLNPNINLQIIGKKSPRPPNSPTASHREHGRNRARLKCGPYSTQGLKWQTGICWECCLS